MLMMSADIGSLSNNILQMADQILLMLLSFLYKDFPAIRRMDWMQFDPDQ